MVRQAPPTYRCTLTRDPACEGATEPASVTVRPSVVRLADSASDTTGTTETTRFGETAENVVGLPSNRTVYSVVQLGVAATAYVPSAAVVAEATATGVDVRARRA